MKNISKVLLIVSGVSVIMPFFYLTRSVLDKMYNGAFYTVIFIAICAGFLSTAAFHSRSIFMTWDEFIKDCYVIRSINSDPWKCRDLDYTGCQISCFAHFVMTVIYGCAIPITASKGCISGCILSVLCFLYYGFISFLFLRRAHKMTNAMQENYRVEQKWQKIKKQYQKVLKDMLDNDNPEYYTAANLHEELPTDIRDQIEKDLSEIREIETLSDEAFEILIEDAWRKVLHKGFSYKEV